MDRARVHYLVIRSYFSDDECQICYNLLVVKGMAVRKQKIINKGKEIEKRLTAVIAVRDTRQKLGKAHCNFNEINILIREMREGKTFDHRLT